MRHLVDAHTLIWALDDPSKLSQSAQAALQNPAHKLTVGVGTMWELSIKSSLSKLRLSSPFRNWMEKAIADLGLELLPISLDHAERQVTLPNHHRDPFDRLLAAQAPVEGIPVVSADAIFDQYGVARIWK